MRHRAVLAVLLLGAGCQAMSPTGNRKELNRIAKVYDDGDVKATIEQLNSYVKKHPRDDLAWTILGHACEDENRDLEAKTAYDEALELNPRRSEALVGQGVLHRKGGRYEEAMRAFEKAVEVNPKDAQAYSSMTLIALKGRQYALALEYARKGYELDAKDPVIAANLAVAYHYNGDVEGRDRLTKVAEELGYRGIDRLHRIYSGELRVLD